MIAHLLLVSLVLPSRSAPVEVSLEELCQEPSLLPNLLMCMDPDKILTAAKAAAGTSASADGAAAGNARVAGSSSIKLSPAAESEAKVLAQNAARALATLLQVRKVDLYLLSVLQQLYSLAV